MAVDPAADKAALVQARLDAQLTAAANARLGKKAGAAAAQAALADPKTRRAILEELYRQQLGAKPEPPKTEGDKDQTLSAEIAWLEDKLRGQVTVSDEDLRQLGKARAEAVQGALLDDGQINAARVFITAQSIADAKGGPVRMTLSLS
jgi:GAF domain-containing protein